MATRGLFPVSSLGHYRLVILATLMDRLTSQPYVTQDAGTVQEKQPEGQDGQETTETADDWKT